MNSFFFLLCCVLTGMFLPLIELRHEKMQVNCEKKIKDILQTSYRICLELITVFSMNKSEDINFLFGLFHFQDIKKWALLFYIYIVTGDSKNLSLISVLEEKFSNCSKTSDIFQ